jgi:hypothetical protein
MASGAPRHPPAHVRRSILDSLGPARVPAARPVSTSPSAWRAFAAAAALLLVAVGLDDAKQRRQGEEMRSQSAALAGRLQTAETALAERVLRARVLESDDVQMMLLGGKGPQPDARARVFWSPRARRGILVASNLAALPADRQYELWVFLDGKPSTRESSTSTRRAAPCSSPRTSPGPMPRTSRSRSSRAAVCPRLRARSCWSARRRRARTPARP